MVAAKGKKKKKTSALKQQHKFSLKAAVWGPQTGLRACQLLAKERPGGGAPPACSPWFPSRPTVQLGTFSISSSGMAGN